MIFSCVETKTSTILKISTTHFSHPFYKFAHPGYLRLWWNGNSTSSYVLTNGGHIFCLSSSNLCLNVVLTFEQRGNLKLPAIEGQQAACDHIAFSSPNSYLHVILEFVHRAILNICSQLFGNRISLLTKVSACMLPLPAFFTLTIVSDVVVSSRALTRRMLQSIQLPVTWPKSRVPRGRKTLRK